MFSPTGKSLAANGGTCGDGSQFPTLKILDLHTAPMIGNQIPNNDFQRFRKKHLHFQNNRRNVRAFAITRTNE